MLDAILGTTILVLLITWLTLSFMGDWQAIKRRLHHEPTDDDTMKRIEEGAFYLRNSGKDSIKKP
jgi:hypothetical protein